MAARSVLTLLLACGLTCGGIARGAEVVISDLGQPSAMRSSNSSHMGNSRTYGASPIGHPTTLGQPTPATRYGSRNQDGYRQIQFQDVTIPTAAGSSVGTGVARPVVGNQQIPTPTRTTVPMSEPISEWGPSEEIFSDDWDMACGGCSDSGCTGCDGCGRRQGLVLDLWLSQGFTGNPDDPQNNFNVPVTFNDRANEYQMNQLYVSLGRAVNTDGHQWDVGGQVDLLYGTDYYFTQAVGLETRIDGSNRWNRSGPRGAGAALYGLAMPQLFAEVYAPIGHGVSVKFGHFYTTIGYESVMAPENFFYSHAYTMQYGEPFTHTGMLADMTIGPRLNIHAGFTRGWDTWEDPNNQLGFLGGYSWTSPSRLASLAMTVHASNEDPAGNFNRTVYSVVYTRRIGCNLRYVMQHDFGTEENVELAGRALETAKWYGLNQYFFYDVSDKLTVGMRAEWFRDQDNARVLAIPIEGTVQGGNYVGLTYGANWKLSDRLTLRPEIRWDWSDVKVPALGRNGMYNDFSEDDQLTLGSDLIFKF